MNKTGISMSDFTLSMIRAFLHRLPSAYDLNKLRIIQRKRAKIKADKAKTRAQEPTKPRARVKTSKRWDISERLKLNKQIGHKLHLDLRKEVNSYPCLSVKIRGQFCSISQTHSAPAHRPRHRTAVSTSLLSSGLRTTLPTKA